MSLFRKSVMLAATLLATLTVVAQDLIPVQNDKHKWGYVDSNGQVVIKYTYDQANAFFDGEALVKKGSKYGYINTSGQETIKIQYTEIGTWDNRGRAKIAVGGSVKNDVLTGAKYGFIDRRGNVLLKPEYDKIESFKDGMAAISKGGKFGYINENLDFIVECKYSAIGRFNDKGFCWVANGGNLSSNKIVGAKFGVVNMSGREVIKPEYQQLGTFSERIFISHPIITGMLNSEKGTKMLKEIAKKNNKGMGTKGFLAGLTGDTQDLLDETKNRAKKSTEEFVDQIVASVPEEVGQLLAETSDYTLLGYEFISGELYTKLDMSLSDNLAVSKNKFFIEGPFTYDLRVNDKIGIIDLNGQFIVKPGQYGLAFLPTEGLVPVVKRSGKIFQFNFCKSDGKLLLKKWVKGTGFIPYNNGTAAIAGEKGTCIYNRDGDVISPEYDLVIPQTDGNYIVKTTAGFGLADGKTGREVVAPAYHSILPASSGLYCVRQSATGLFGYLDATGKYAIEPTYTSARSFSHGAATVATADGWGVIKPDNSGLVKFSWDDALPFSADAPSLCWVKKNDAWHCLDIAKGEKAFETTFAGVANFDTDGIAVVNSADGLYGTIDTAGNVLLPLRFSSPDVIGVVNSSMGDNGVKTLTEIEAHRMNLNLNPTRNNFRLSHTIDNAMWEY